MSRCPPSWSQRPYTNRHRPTGRWESCTRRSSRRRSWRYSSAMIGRSRRPARNNRESDALTRVEGLAHRLGRNRRQRIDCQCGGAGRDVAYRVGDNNGVTAGVRGLDVGQRVRRICRAADRAAVKLPLVGRRGDSRRHHRESCGVPRNHSLVGRLRRDCRRSVDSKERRIGCHAAHRVGHNDRIRTGIADWALGIVYEAFVAPPIVRYSSAIDRSEPASRSQQP